MRLQILLTLFLQVALVESLTEVSGYLGDNVTLLSGADPSWTLSTIEWSIFPNNTWIATYRNGKKNIDRIDRYKRRLSLNTSSGDLMIHNLNAKDAMEYTVDLITNGQDSVKKINLIVRERLQKPTIQTFNYASRNSGCWIELHCSSVDTDVDLSWHFKPPSVTAVNISGHGSNSTVLLVFLNTTQNLVEFTCTSSRKMENAENVVTPKCHDDMPQPQPPPQPQPEPPRSRDGVVFFGGIIVGSLLTAFIIGLYFFRKQIRAQLDSLRESPPPGNQS
nr:putative immunoglobulin superfamily protein [Oplegnathus fasciatus]